MTKVVKKMICKINHLTYCILFKKITRRESLLDQQNKAIPYQIDPHALQDVWKSIENILYNESLISCTIKDKLIVQPVGNMLYNEFTADRHPTNNAQACFKEEMAVCFRRIFIEFKSNGISAILLFIF